MSTMEAAMAAKASGQVLTGDALAEIIARMPSDGNTGPGGTDTQSRRQRQVGLG